MKALVVVAVALVACGSTTQTTPCDPSISCGAHGTCAIALSKPVCVCDDGYKAEGLSCVASASTDGGPVDAGSVATADAGSTNPTDAGTATTADAGTVVFHGGGDAGTFVTLITQSEVSDHAWISGIAIDEAYVYFAERSDNTGSTTYHAKRKSLGGGAIQDLGDIGTPVLALTLSATDLYLCKADAIVAMPKAGGAARTVATTGASCLRRGGIGGAPPDFIIAGDHLYFVDNFAAIKRVALTGGTPEVIAAANVVSGGIFGLAIVGDTLFAAGLFSMVSMKLDGSSLTTLFATASYASSLSITTGSLYFVSSSDNALYSVPVSGGTVTQTSFTPSGISAYVIVGSSYWECSTKSLYLGAAGLLPKELAPFPQGIGTYVGGLVVTPTQVIIAFEYGVASYTR